MLKLCIYDLIESSILFYKIGTMNSLVLKDRGTDLRELKCLLQGHTTNNAS